MSRLIFVDVDGVLNSAKFLDWRRKYGSAWTHNPERWSDLDPYCVALLDELVIRTDAYLVLSSTWRLRAIGLDKTIEALETHGFRSGYRFLGSTCRMFRTPEGEPRYRCHEIQDWLDQDKDIESFCILDDDSDMVHLMPHLVHTSWHHGLTPWDCERAEALLLDAAPLVP
jgi:hypothetical protein